MALTRLLPFLLLLASFATWAAGPVLRVSGPEPAADEVATLLAQQMPALSVRRDATPARLVVAVGAEAFREAVAAQVEGREAAPVVGVALTRQAWRQVQPGRHTALYWEPDPVRQLRLARVLMPSAKRFGVVLGAPDDVLTQALRAEATRLGLTLTVDVGTRGKALSHRLNAILANSDFLLGIDDPGVFTPELAKTVLLTSYRHGKPVIGPTAAWVSAGSVASLSASIPETVDALAAWMPALLADGQLPPPRYAGRYAGVATNPNVARSLQLGLPTVQRLEALLREEEGKP